MAKLNPNVELILSSAARLASENKNEFVCLEHLLLCILEDPEGSRIIKAVGGKPARIKKKLIDFLETSLEKMNHPLHAPPQTIAFQRVLQRAILHSEYSSARSLAVGDLIAALFTEHESHASFYLLEEGIERLDVLDYISHGPRIGYQEEAEIDEEFDDEFLSDDDFADFADEEGYGRSQKDTLETLCEDLTQQAREEKLDPLIGRQKELEQIIQILSRRLKNNPLLVGDQGVGKTAIIEGLAQRIVSGHVPSTLKDSRLLSLNLGNMLAGTRYRGDFEQKLKSLIDSLKKEPKTILFIDEIHNLVGAGATSGSTLDAANMLKPVLARGEIKCIGSTTFEEYKSHFEKDRALTRRFLKVDIPEPTLPDTIKILEGLKPHFETYHNVKYSPTALRAAVVLSDRHIRDRFLPDKAIDIVDEVGARQKLKQELNNSSDKVYTIRAKDIENLLADTKGIPQTSLNGSEIDRLRNLGPEVRKFIYGQDSAVKEICTSILRSRAGLGNEKRPIGSFLLVGPTGVGKTELARQLARILDLKLQKFDMSEYQEKHSVARLVGAPPGYVGHEEGGLLTDAALKNPRSIILLDEIEKAHGDIYNILLQVMDDGVLTDSLGRKAYFSECIIIMTSNVGSEGGSGLPLGFANAPRGINNAALEKTFRPEFRNRLDAIIRFSSLPEEVVEKVVDKFISDIDVQLNEKKASLTVSNEARNWFAKRGFSQEYGARSVYRLVQKEVRDRLSEEILFGSLKNGGEAHIDVKDDNLVFNFTPRKQKKKKTKLKSKSKGSTPKGSSIDG